MKLHNPETILKECPQIFIYTVVCLLLSIIFYKIKNRNLPPGPWGLPLVGYWPYLEDKDVHLQLQKLMKKYGDVYTFNVTGQLYIHLGSIKSIKEIHLTNSDCFVDRSKVFTPFSLSFAEGVAGANGEKWKILRKFFIQMLREYGLSSGKGISDSIYDSSNSFIECLRAANREPVDIMAVLGLHCSTILRRMLFNDDGITTEELLDITEAYEKLMDVFIGKRIFLAGNLAKYMIMPFDSRYQVSADSYQRINGILRNIIKRHQDTLDEQSIRNIIDSYYTERNERKRKHDPSADYFTDEALVSSFLPILGDGVLSIAGIICYHVSALLEYPDEQEKIFKELEDIIGPDRQPSIKDKSNLPYTNAFMLEVIRTSDFINVFPTVECTKETTVGEYRIPKGAIAVMNFFAAHRDPNIYDEPDKFKPSRFLKEPGKGKTELPILFGVGKRSCIGESFTNIQTFMFIATTVKNFRLEIPEGASNKSFLEGKMEIIAHPRMKE